MPMLPPWAGAPPASARASIGQPCSDRITSLCAALGTGAAEQSSGAKLGETSRVKAKLLRSCGGFRVVVGNWSKVNEKAAQNTITIKVGLEMANGEVLPVNWGGKESVTIEKGMYAISDIAPANGLAGETVWIRTYVSVAAEGLKWPLSLTLNKAEGEGVTAGNTDKSQGASEVPPSEGTCYSPVLLLAVSPNELVPVVGLHGDSILAGNHGTPIDIGWAKIAFAPSGQAYVEMSKGGGFAETAAKFNASEGRWQMVDFANYALEAYGVNDVNTGRTFAQIKADKETIWRRLIERGQKVFATTVTPIATSTDGFTTLKNQTPGVHDTTRQEVNAWLRTRPAQLEGLIDTASAVESGISGKWIPLMTEEGIHPLQIGHEAMARLLRPGQLFR